MTNRFREKVVHFEMVRAKNTKSPLIIKIIQVGNSFKMHMELVLFGVLKFYFLLNKIIKAVLEVCWLSGSAPHSPFESNKCMFY